MKFKKAFIPLLLTTVMFADVEMITGDKPFEDLIAQLEEKLKTCVKNS